MPAQPRLAATVILLRPAADGYEIFLVKRHQNSAFMGGAHVFPGGKVDAADGADALVAACAGRTPAECVARLGRPDGAALHVAAIRELFEEAGALLADRGDGGAPLDLAAPAEAARFATHRSAMDQSKKPFVDFVREEALRLRLDHLHWWAHWITPELETRRFDAWFFVATLPAGQTPLHDDRETVESLWVSPPEALARHRAGTLSLPPPTLRNIELLAAHATIDAVCAAADTSAPPVILPTVDHLEGKLVLLLPGDPLYRTPDGVPLDAAGAPRGLGGPTRFVLEGGRWETRYA